MKLHFVSGKELHITDYSRLELNRRQGDQVHINISNSRGDLAFNSLFDEIQTLLNGDDTFIVIIESGGNTAVYDSMTVNYYMSGDSEMLHFSKSQI